MKVKNSYVLTFLFSKDLSQILLIKKRRPSWMIGLYNGVGGKVNFGECDYKASRRELEEETGLILKDSLIDVMTMHYDSCKVYVSTCATDEIFNAKQTTDEELIILQTSSVNVLPCVNDLKYIIPLCLERLTNGN